jgi:DnaJ homolog subfamily C member 3
MRVKALFVGLIPLLLTPLVLSETDQTTQQYLAQGNAHLAKGQFNDALVSFDAAIQKDPRNYLTYFRRAATYLSLGRVNAALDDFDIILELKPDFEQALIQRARLRAKEGMFASAIADLKKYTKLKPADAEAEELVGG